MKEWKIKLTPKLYLFFSPLKMVILALCVLISLMFGHFLYPNEILHGFMIAYFILFGFYVLTKGFMMMAENEKLFDEPGMIVSGIFGIFKGIAIAFILIYLICKALSILFSTTPDQIVFIISVANILLPSIVTEKQMKQKGKA